MKTIGDFGVDLIGTNAVIGSFGGGITSGEATIPDPGSQLWLEDGVSFLKLEDNISFLLLEL